MTLSIGGNQLVEPKYFHREYENDIGPTKIEEPDQSAFGLAQRVAFASLPFFSLYKPLSFPLALGMGSVRVLTSAVTLYAAIQEGDAQNISIQMIQTAVAITALAATILAHPLGMLISTGHDIVVDSGHLIYALNKGDYKTAGEKTLSLINNSLYLSLFVAGTLEMYIASLSMQVLLGLYHSSEDFKHGRWIEGTAHLLMGGVRTHQLVGQVQMLQLRNEYERKRKAFIKEVKAAEKKMKDNMASEESGTGTCPNGSVCLSMSATEQTEGKTKIISHAYIQPQSASNTANDDVVSRMMKYKESGSHALHKAVEANDLEVVKIFLDSGMDVNYRVQGPIIVWRDGKNYYDEDYSPVEISIKNNLITMTSFLLDRGANLYYPRGINYFGDRRYQGYHDWESAIYITIKQKNYEMLQMLADRKVNFEKPCHGQDTGNQVALASGDREIISIVFGVK